MSRSINSVQLLGHLGKDAETRHTPNGNAVTNFSIATSRRFKKGDDWQTVTDWHNVQMWGGENVSPYLLKGTQVHVTGRLQTRSWDKDGQKRYATEVVVQSSDLILLGGNDQGSQRPPAAPEDDMTISDEDSDVPF